MDFSDPHNPKKYYFNICRPINPVLGCDRHASVCQIKYEQVGKRKRNLTDYWPLCDHFGASGGRWNRFSLFKVALPSPQGSMKEVVSVSNMGIAKGGPIIQDRDRLLLKFTDGSDCTSDGQKLSYSTLIYLACSRGAQVRRICASWMGSMSNIRLFYRYPEIVQFLILNTEVDQHQYIRSWN